MSTYRYTKLKANGDGDEIRVLQLNSCQPGAPLTGSLTPHLLKRPGTDKRSQDEPHPSTYEAVSYHWGSDKTTPFDLIIDPDGDEPTTIKLTTSQHNVIRQFSLPDRKRALWIDAICIEQSSAPEKEQQIKLMARIFEGAERVLVYLGAEANDSELAIDLVEHVAEFSHFLDDSCFPPGRSGYDAAVAAGLKLPPVEDTRSWKAWRAFWKRPWFRRVWIIQEFVLATDLKVYCGSRELSWIKLKMVAVAEANCISLIYAGYSQWGGSQHHKDFREAPEGAVAFVRVCGFRLSRWGPQKLLGLSDAKWEYWRQNEPSTREYVLRRLSFAAIYRSSGPKWDLIDLLQMTKNFHATNPVDRMYSLLGLADNVDSDDFAPSYEEGQTLAVVTQRFATALIQRGRCPEVLALAGLHDGTERAPDPVMMAVIDWVHQAAAATTRTLIGGTDDDPSTAKDCHHQLKGFPSWVPDWASIRYSQAHTRSFSMDAGLIKSLQQDPILGKQTNDEWDRPIYCAALDTVPVYEIESATNVLKLKGRRFDTIAIVLPDRMSTCPSLYEELAKNIVLPYPTGEPLVEVIWRTMVANRTFEGGRAPASFGDEYARMKLTDNIILCNSLFLALVGGILGIALVTLAVKLATSFGSFRGTLVFSLLAMSFVGTEDWPLFAALSIAVKVFHWTSGAFVILVMAFRWNKRNPTVIPFLLLRYGPTTSMVPNVFAPPSQFSCFSQSLAMTACKYHFCVTASRLVALVPLSTKQGDQIAVFHGCAAPFVIRPHHIPGLFQLIGEAYVHGAMEGEIMRNQNLVDEMLALR